MHTLTQIIKRHLRHILLALSLVLGTQAAQAGVPTLDSATLGSSMATQLGAAAEYVQTAARYAQQVQKWQEELQRWQQQYQNMISGNFGALTSALGLGSGTLTANSNRNAFKKFIDDYQNNGRCERMSDKQQVAKSLCEARRNVDVARFKIMAEMLDYSDQKNVEINNALKQATEKTGTEEKKLALAQVQTLQNNLKDGVEKYNNRMKGYQEQSDMLKAQQAEVARTIMQGKPPGLIGGIVSAGIMKVAFEGAKHR